MPLALLALLGLGFLFASSKARAPSPADIPGVPTTAPPGTDLGRDVQIIHNMMASPMPEYRITDIQVLKTATGYKTVETLRWTDGGGSIRTALYTPDGKRIAGSWVKDVP